MTAPHTRRLVPPARRTWHRRRPTVAELERRVLLDGGAGGGGGIHPNLSTAYISIAITGDKTSHRRGQDRLHRHGLQGGWYGRYQQQ